MARRLRQLATAIGIEHEGYAASASHPTSLYNASALLTRGHLQQLGHRQGAADTCPPGILGHIDINNCVCGGSHWDPGGGWDWGYYIQQVSGAPPPRLRRHYTPAVVSGDDGRRYRPPSSGPSTRNDGTATWGHAATNLGTSGPAGPLQPVLQCGQLDQRDTPDRSGPDRRGSGPGRPVHVHPQGADHAGRLRREVQARAGRRDLVRRRGRPGPSPSRPRQGNITGTVRNAANGAAISGATVAISGGASTTTNSSGVYTFTGLAPATYTLNVSKAGFSPASGTATVTAGSTTTKDFNLTSTDTTPPSAPAGLTATGISPSQINLSWTASTDTGGAGLAGYIIYRNSAEVGRTTASPIRTTAWRRIRPTATIVKAYDNANNVSGASNTASDNTDPGTVPIFEDGFINANSGSPS